MSQLLCCTCLEPSTDDVPYHALDSDPTASNELILKEKLLFCVPEFEDTLGGFGGAPFICNICCQALCWGYCFRKMCLEVKRKVELDAASVCVVKQETVDVDETIEPDGFRKMCLEVKRRLEVEKDDASVKEEIIDIDETYLSEPDEVKMEVFSDEEKQPPEDFLLAERACNVIPVLTENDITPQRLNCFVRLELLDNNQLKQLTKRKNRRKGKKSVQLFHCEICGRRYTNLHFFNNHQKTHNKVKNVALEDNVLREYDCNAIVPQEAAAEHSFISKTNKQPKIQKLLFSKTSGENGIESNWTLSTAEESESDENDNFELVLELSDSEEEKLEKATDKVVENNSGKVVAKQIEESGGTEKIMQNGLKKKDTPEEIMSENEIDSFEDSDEDYIPRRREKYRLPAKIFSRSCRIKKTEEEQINKQTERLGEKGNRKTRRRDKTHTPKRKIDAEQEKIDRAVESGQQRTEIQNNPVVGTCAFYFNIIAKLKNQETVFVTTICPTCKDAFNEEYYNKTHKHICGRTLKDYEETKVSYHCSTCGETFDEMYALNLHCVVHKYEEPPEEVRREEEPDGAVGEGMSLRKYKCGQCNMCFDSNEVLKMHCVFKHRS